MTRSDGGSDRACAKASSPRANRSSPTASKRSISSIYSFAMDADLVRANPAPGYENGLRSGSEQRVLSDEELRLFWMRIVAETRLETTRPRASADLAHGRAGGRDGRGACGANFGA